jgi:hypothetical protein
MSVEGSSARAVVDQLLRDPPLVHQMGGDGGAPPGVWSTDRSCYDFLASHCRPGARTLETGLGVSTALFARLGCVHTCLTPNQSEVDRLRAYCDRTAIPLDQVRFVVGDSASTLPGLPVEDLDVVLLDGSHGFPVPMIDWFYGASHLRPGGLLVLDDIHLPAVAMLVGHLTSDPRWPVEDRTAKWAAFRRTTAGSLSEDWWLQPFAQHPDRLGPLLARRAPRLARASRPVIDAVRRWRTRRQAGTSPS